MIMRATSHRKDIGRCACPNDVTSLTSALNCFASDTQPCKHRKTNASNVIVRGLECATDEHAHGVRGFFVLSRDSAGHAVCTGGDLYHLWVVEQQDDWRFASLSQPVGPNATPSAYWMNMSLSALPGNHTYNLTLSLVETQWRAQQWAEGREVPHWRADGTESPLLDWLRSRRCAWQQVALPDGLRQISYSSPAQSARPACTVMPPSSTFAYRRVHVCSGRGRCNQTRRRILDTSNAQRWQQRLTRGFEHVLESTQCTFRWMGEGAVERCLAGKQLLNVGSDAVDLQRGFARLNRSLVAWTRVHAHSY